MSSALAIEQLIVECHVPAVAEERRARGILERVLSSVQHELPDYLDRILAAETDSEAIVVIDTLRFDATINAQWPRERIARALANQLSCSLWRALERPDAMRFQDRPEMLARFFSDLAQGTAYARVWHRAFDGLRLLPASAIVRTLIGDEPLASRTALSRLLPADLDRVIALLSRADAERALAAVLSTANPETACDPASVVAAALSQRCLALETPQQQLALAVAIARQPDAEANAGALALAGVLFGLAATCDPGEPGVWVEFQGLVQRLAADGDAAALAEVRSGLARFDADAVEDAVKALRREQPRADVRELHAGCGGAWLLLPSILSALEGRPDAAALALLVLAASAGARAPEVWNSAPLREALGVDEGQLAHATSVAWPLPGLGAVSPPTSDGIEEQNRAHMRLGLAVLALPRGAARIIGQLASEAMNAYARRLPGFAGSSFRYLWDNLLATDGSIRTDSRAIDVALKPPPLDVIWKITGADRARYALPDGRAVRVAVRR